MSTESKRRTNQTTNSESSYPPKIPKRSKKIKQHITHTKKLKSKGPWTLREQERFLEAIEKYGNSWKDVAAYIGSRNSNQCCSHAQKHFMRIRRLKAVEMRKNPETKNHVFVVVKHFYNTALIQKERILSYQHSNVTPRFEEENLLQEVEENESVNSGNKESEEQAKSMHNLKHQTTFKFYEELVKGRSETREDHKNEYIDHTPIIHPIPCLPLRFYPQTIIYPAHFNHFANYPQKH
jgi:SHAQKYF class myb-like DNA-binding protein